MRLALGLLLVVLALVGGYFVLSGKFPPSSTTAPAGAPEPIGQAAASAAGVQGTGDGGASVLGRLSHLGIPTFLAASDIHASRGGFHHVS